MREELPGPPIDSRPDPGWKRCLRDLAAGRPGALAALYDRAAPAIYGLALWRTGSPQDAEDVVQDTFVRLAERGGRLRHVRDARSWVLAVAHRLAVDRTRRRRVRQGPAVDDCGFLAAPDDSPDRKIDARRASEHLASLPAPQREALYLHHFQGFTFAVIGEITGVPTFTAASRYRLGLRKLRRLMEEGS